MFWLGNTVRTSKFDVFQQIETQKLNFKEHAKARTDHGADIIIQSDSPSHHLSNTSSPGSLNVTEAPPLDTLADQVRNLPVQSKLYLIRQNMPIINHYLLPAPFRCLPPLPNKGCDWMRQWLQTLHPPVTKETTKTNNILPFSSSSPSFSSLRSERFYEDKHFHPIRAHKDKSTQVLQTGRDRWRYCLSSTWKQMTTKNNMLKPAIRQVPKNTEEKCYQASGLTDQFSNGRNKHHLQK